MTSTTSTTSTPIASRPTPFSITGILHTTGEFHLTKISESLQTWGSFSWARIGPTTNAAGSLKLVEETGARAADQYRGRLRRDR
jgi:hypothetical protein